MSPMILEKKGESWYLSHLLNASLLMRLLCVNIMNSDIQSLDVFNVKVL